MGIFWGWTVGFSCRKQWSIRSECDYFRTTDMKITFLKQCVKPKMCYNVSISQEFRSKVCLSVIYFAVFFKNIFSFQNRCNNILALWWEFFWGWTVGYSWRKQWSIRSESDYFRTTDMKITFLKQWVKLKMCYNVSISQEFRSKVCLSVTYFAVFFFKYFLVSRHMQ